MKLKTSKGNEYDVAFVDGPSIVSGRVILEMADPRRLPKIAAEFDGLTHLERTDANQGNKRWEGYTELAAITRQPSGSVLILLAKEG